MSFEKASQFEWHVQSFVRSFPNRSSNKQCMNFFWTYIIVALINTLNIVVQIFCIIILIDSKKAMKKFFSVFKKRKTKEEIYCNFPFDLFSTEVYRNYEFDSDFRNKLKEGLNDFEGDINSQLVESDSIGPSRHETSSKMEHISSEKEKSTKNLYVITMSNCKYFHIGPQKTINVSSDDFNRKGSSLPENLNKLFDCQKKISEANIMVISLHIGSNWKELGRNLGLEENYLEELKYRSDENTIVMSFDILQKYLTLFPNTSIGFIVHILNEIQQVRIIKEIAKNIQL